MKRWAPGFACQVAWWAALASFSFPAQAQEMCPLDSSYSGVSAPEAPAPSTQAHTAGQSCFVQWQDIEAGLPSYLLVDVRSAEDYEAIHLSSAIHLAPRLIKTKAFLRNRNVLLLGYGFEGASLEQLCGELRESGFKQVQALRGGIPAALQNGARFGGTSLPSDHQLMSPEQVVSEYFADGLHLIVEDETLKIPLQDFGLTATHLSAQVGSEAWFAQAQRLQLESTPAGARKRPVVLLAKDGPNTTGGSVGERGIWQLNVSTDELVSFLDRNEWTKLKRNSPPTRFQCPNL